MIFVQGHEKMTLKKDDRVVPSGYGRIKSWNIIAGTVIRIRGNSVFVHWEPIMRMKWI